ncbi:hypothetical protein ACFLSE_08580 [Bacteroidota bacterium]
MSMKTFNLIFGIAICVLISLTSLAQNNTPELNKEIVKYVESVIGKKVDRGECWDLANQALILVNADWDKAYVYGNSIDPTKDKVFPGDLIQFKNVKVQYTEGNATYTELMAHHTAVVYKVLEKGIYEIAHQNTQFSGRKVGISKLNLNHVIKGKLYFYRPTLNLEN